MNGIIIIELKIKKRYGNREAVEKESEIIFLARPGHRIKRLKQKEK